MGANEGVPLVPRYFFMIRRPNNLFEDDPHGTVLPDPAAARSFAEQTIKELRNESGFDDPLLMMIVRDDSNRTILSLPFLPAFA
jgi:hypothetical protein